MRQGRICLNFDLSMLRHVKKCYYAFVLIQIVETTSMENDNTNTEYKKLFQNSQLKGKLYSNLCHIHFLQMAVSIFLCHIKDK